MLEFIVDGNEYRARKLNAFQQLHVSRKLAVILPKALPALLAASADNGDMTAILGAFEPAAEALAAMPEEDVNYVYQTCLGVVSRHQGKGLWAAVWNESGKTMMFDDITLPVMSRLVFAVLKDSLGPFFEGLLALAPAAAGPTTA